MKYNDKHNLFFQNQNWDTEEPILGHEKRFLAKLEERPEATPNVAKLKPKKKIIPLSLVASIVFVIGSLTTFFIINQKTTVQLSPETQQTQDYFSSVMEKELTELKSKENPKNKKIIQDALVQLEILEKDYDLLKTEIAKNGENKQIIHALLTNMQTRISFIQSVMEEIDNVNQLKMNHNENTL